MAEYMNKMIMYDQLFLHKQSKAKKGKERRACTGVLYISDSNQLLCKNAEHKKPFFYCVFCIQILLAVRCSVREIVQPKCCSYFQTNFQWLNPVLKASRFRQSMDLLK